MKHAILVFSLLLFACTKTDCPVADECWTCTDTYGTTKDFTVCDPVEAAWWDGRRWEDNEGWHLINCDPE